MTGNESSLDSGRREPNLLLHYSWTGDGTRLDWTRSATTTRTIITTIITHDNEIYQSLTHPLIHSLLLLSESRSRILTMIRARKEDVLRYSQMPTRYAEKEGPRLDEIKCLPPRNQSLRVLGVLVNLLDMSIQI